MRFYICAVALLPLVGLAGCVTNKEALAARHKKEAASDDTYCRSLSAKPGSNAYINCRVTLKSGHQQQELADEARSAAYGQEMRLLGAQMMNQPAPAPVRMPLRCTSMPAGMVMNTTCY